MNNRVLNRDANSQSTDRQYTRPTHHRPNTGGNRRSEENNTEGFHPPMIIMNLSQTRLLVSGRSPECPDCLLRFMEQ